MANPKLDHDDGGFLTGEAIDLSRAMDVWSEIQTDIAAIRKALTQGDSVSTKAPAAPSGKDGVQTSTVAVPRSNVRQGLLANDAVQAAMPALQRPASPDATAAIPGKPVRPTATRDASGRFIAGSGKKPGGKGDGERAPGAKDDPRNESAIAGLIKRIGAAASGSAGGIEEADPTVKAFNEIAQPLSQGYSMLTGGGSREEQGKNRWFRRIFGELRIFRSEETAFSKASTKALKEIEKKPTAEGSSGGGMAGGVFARIGGLAPALLGFGKKVPYLGAILASAVNIFDIFESETDDSLSRGEKDKKTGKGVGGLAGSLGGMVAGAKLGGVIGLLGGPIGAAIGGLVGGAAGLFFGNQAGQIVGEKVGGWVADLRAEDIPGKIAATWDSATSDIRAKWDASLKELSGVWSSIKTSAESAFDWAKEKGDQANTFIKDATGVDVKETAKAAIEGTKAAAIGAIESVKGAGNSANDYVKEKTGVDVKGSAKAAVSAAKEGASQARDKASDAAAWIGDKVTGKSGRNKEALIAEMGRSGMTDPNEQAMFMSQMDHESGGFKTYEENLNYSAKGLRTTFGKYYKTDEEAQAAARNPEMIANKVYGGRMGNTEAGDGYKYRGRGATQLTGKDNYTKAGDALGLDLVNNPDLAKEPENAAKIASWYWKQRKIGDAAKSGNVEAVTKKINGGLNGIGDRKEKFEKYVAQANAGAFNPESTSVAQASTQKPSAAVGVATADTAPRTAQAVPAPTMAAAPTAISPSAVPVSMAASSPAQVAYMPAVQSPSIPVSPPVPDAPQIAAPMGTGGAAKPTQVNVSQPDHGQDVRDRRIAHIVTGGYSA